MKNLILQHYSGDIDPLARLSIENIEEYADLNWNDYKLLRGPVFNASLSPQCQKLAILDEQFDDYDNVVMLDADMFARTSKNIFDATGMGRHTKIQAKLLSRISYRYPDFANKDAPYWGGAVYKFDRKTRQKLRAVIPDIGKLIEMDRMLRDESIMHYLAWKAKIPVDDETYFSGDCGGEEWDRNSFDDPINGNIIHIRPKWTLTGPKATKLEIYRDLVKKCVI